MATPSRKRSPGTRIPARRAKVFWTGRSQAVRLPKEFRFTAKEVSVRRDGARVILEPVAVPRDAKGWPLALWRLMGAAPEFDLGDRGQDAPRDPFEDMD